MKIDLHCHSRYSYDNDLAPEDVIREALDQGLDGVCFTEHFSVEASAPVDEIAVPKGFVVLRGVEISTDQGHLLAYGLRDDLWNRWTRRDNLPSCDVVRTVHALGGVCAPAHPFRGYDSVGESVHEFGLLDALETHNGRDGVVATKSALDLARTLGLPSIGGSDCHRRSQVGMAFTTFDSPIGSLPELVEAIIRGSCHGEFGRRRLLSSSGSWSVIR